MSIRCFVPNCPTHMQKIGAYALHRINAKGQPGVWACERHVKNTDAPPRDPAVQTIVDALVRP